MQRKYQNSMITLLIDTSQKYSKLALKEHFASSEYFFYLT